MENREQKSKQANPQNFFLALFPLCDDDDDTYRALNT